MLLEQENQLVGELFGDWQHYVSSLGFLRLVDDSLKRLDTSTDRCMAKVDFPVVLSSIIESRFKVGVLGISDVEKSFLKRPQGELRLEALLHQLACQLSGDLPRLYQALRCGMSSVGHRICYACPALHWERFRFGRQW